MQRKPQVRYAFSSWQIRFAALIWMAIALGFLAHPLPAQEHTYGYSYLRMQFARQPIVNFVHDPKYQGWLSVESVTARTLAHAESSASRSSSADAGPKIQKASPQWKNLPSILVSGWAGAGEINFGAADDGGLAPLINAQKRKSLIESAELDLYEEDGAAFIGKYRLKGIRVLKLEDVPASACAMYLVTMSFQSVQKIQ